ncbi:SHOCT domain-containing protein [Secundilactobacillus silagei]|uniref:SHOCT domain-containing protein n=1 Tax=Secundilactobacillus silagei TaxID=1293415 RepID=UPI0020932980|nr:SHOCT domain-containing protein [Secundilactobacillus silagei]
MKCQSLCISKITSRKKVRFISFETKTDSFTYRSAQESCLSFCQKLDEISTAQKQEQEIGQSSEQPTQAQYNTSDIADQLRQFKQLADDGVITQEEFEAKKRNNFLEFKGFSPDTDDGKS